MPTGYTATLCEKEQPFSEFVLQCARAFGACIEQRDDPMTDLPKKSKASSYHADHVESAKKELEQLLAMSDTDKLLMGKKQKASDLKYARNALKKRKEVRQRIQTMIDQVKQWTPPTPDHNGLKNFMLEQLDSTLRHDGDVEYYERDLERAKLEPLMSYHTLAVERAEWNIKYHQKEALEEETRVDNRNQWINDLIKSVADPDLAWKLLQQAEQ